MQIQEYFESKNISYHEYCWDCANGNHPDDGSWDYIECPECGAKTKEEDNKKRITATDPGPIVQVMTPIKCDHDKATIICDNCQHEYCLDCVANQPDSWYELECPKCRAKAKEEKWSHNENNKRTCRASRMLGK